MSTIYSDIDLSLEMTAYKDFPILTDFNAIKRTIYNTIFISAKQVPFDNTSKPRVQDVIHELDNFLTRFALQDALKKLILKDSRITRVLKLDVATVPNNPSTWTVDVQLAVNYNNVGVRIVDFNLILT